MTPKSAIPININSPKIMFAQRFLRCLSNIREKRTKSRSIEDIQKRSQRIKIAAYSSMARAVGSRRVWSRALLFKLRSRARHHGLVRRRSLLGVKNKRVIKNKPSRELSKAEKLRKLVPGGQAMDICSLLEETAHYIKCLSTQVKVMQSIADHYSK